MLREGILTSGAFAANIDNKKPTLLGMCTTAPLWPIVGGLGAVQGYTCQVSKLTQHPASPFWLKPGRQVCRWNASIGRIFEPMPDWV